MGGPSASEKKLVAGMLEMLELEDIAGARPSEISGGQRQRVALARALITRPKALQARYDIPVVIITHDPADVEAFGGTVVEFNVGETLREAAAFNRFSPLPRPAFRF